MRLLALIAISPFLPAILAAPLDVETSPELAKRNTYCEDNKGKSGTFRVQIEELVALKVRVSKWIPYG
jgi:hypothetical protein